jgi:acyl-CoA thioesterase
MPPASDATREHIESDPFRAALGVDLLDLRAGGATTRLTLGERHLNVHETPHGGAIYALADAAFTAASNSTEATRVALETNVSYLGAASIGETHLAVAEETHATRRTVE